MNPGDLLRNRYQIERALAAGGFGETYMAIDLDYPGRRQVVVKHLKPASNDPGTLQIARRLFESEAQVLAELGESSDRLPALYAYFEEQSEFYLVQEFIGGATLTAELAGRKLSEGETIEVLQEILAGLAVVHGKNKIHRDLKPDNIMRREKDGKLVLIDFGAVKEVRQAAGMGTNAALSASIGIGTQGYMPTEQAIGFPRLASDVYAVGAIGIQCLTGKHPNELFDEEILALRWQHLCKVSVGLATVLEKMVAQQPNERYKNGLIAVDVVEQLSVSCQPQPPTVPSPAAPTQKSSIPPVQPAAIVISKISFASVRLDRTGKILERPEGSAIAFQEDLGNGISLTMVKIPAGEFIMGSPANEEESPQHQVKVPEFYLGQTLVTQGQWQALMGRSPSMFTSMFKRGNKLPVDTVNWLDAMDFCEKLSQKTGHTYRLPSEAEWEYACRAGTTTPFAFGETITPAVVNYNGNYTYGKAPIGEYRKKTTMPGSFPANLFGLYDMHGNLWEWCLDEWSDNYQNAPNDGSARGDITSRDNSKMRILRGGSWGNDPYYCRSTIRFRNGSDLQYDNIGFRVVYAPARTP
jgi:eukaryotic-like serine/threonine-protein kinase